MKPDRKMMDDLMGMEIAKRAIEVALAGKHGILFLVNNQSPPFMMDFVEASTQIARKAGVEVNGIHVSTYCSCGNFGSRQKECSCEMSQIKVHQNQIMHDYSGQCDIVLDVAWDIPANKFKGEAEDTIASRINGVLKCGEVSDELNESCTAMLRLFNGEYPTTRNDSIMRVAKTIAKLNGVNQIEIAGLCEAIQYQMPFCYMERFLKERLE